MMGGVSAFTRQHFEKINGYSNDYWGWGGEDEDIAKRIEAGATILNVSGGRKTASIVRNIRKRFPEFPIIATGGPTEESISETIQAGANAITFTPPSSASIMGHLMDEYRKE